MKKRLLALVTTLMLMVSASTAVYASDGFNKAVFDNDELVNSKLDMIEGLVPISAIQYDAKMQEAERL